MMGVWLAILLAIGFIGVYAWQITEEARQLADALAATELVLAREQHLSQLDGLAAAAAHELGTPLSTIAVVAKELRTRIRADAPHGEDMQLLREQAHALPRHPRQAHRVVVERRAVRPHAADRADRGGGRAAPEFRRRHRRRRCRDDRSGEPVGARNPAILYGLGNLVENAVDFARERVEVDARWTRRHGRGHDHATTARALRRRSWTASASPTSPAAAAAASDGDDERGRARPWLLHRQDAARALRRQLSLRKPPRAPSAAPSCDVRWAAAISSAPLSFAAA